MNNIGVSIIIPTRNEELYLPYFFNSFRTQTIDPEIIIVDTGSTDKTLSIANEYADKTIQIIPDKYIKRDLEITAIARNIGADYSTKDILIHTDADITLQDNHQLERILYYFNNSEIGTTYIKNKDENIINRIRQSIASLFNIASNFIIVRKDVFKDTKFPPGAWHDLRFSINAKLKGYKIKRIPEVIIHNRQFYDIKELNKVISIKI